VGHDEVPEGKSNQPGKFLSFWTTLPGVLTGAAALITAIIGVVALLHPTGGSGGPGTASTSVPLGAPQSVISPDVSDVSAAPGVIATGTLTMTNLTYANLEQGIAGNGVSPSDFAFVRGGFGYEFDSGTGFAPPMGDEPADKSACVSALTKRQDSREDVEQLHIGSQLCVETHDAYVAVITIVRLPGVGSGEVVFDYTVWQ
jgi:hypothetical protein